ncbi:hypothetical protein ACHHYP_08111 [Achlya hypogyna]|uniref:Uncharacterized protein n=1 Tax=Achlya hypogyna TaxID=1202772 RepID=A0A1V9YPT2_ACHHY|nr:hypothetical protein ACHHYP_08111 [Achlya hypogyna]
MSDILSAEQAVEDVATLALPTLDACADETIAALRNDILELEKEFVFKQIKQQFFDDLTTVGSPEAMAEFAANASLELEQGKTVMLQKEKDFNEAFEARTKMGQTIETTLAEIDARRAALMKRIADTKALAKQNDTQREEWKALQRLNTQKKTVLELTFKLHIPKDMVCTELVQAQTQGIQEDNERERVLEDQLLDLTAQVKQSEATINTLLQESARRAEDAQLLERIDQHHNLVEMSSWYQKMTRLAEAISGIHVLKCEGSEMFVKIGAYSVAVTIDVPTGTLQTAKASSMIPNDIDVSDIVEVAVEENDLALLLREARHRIANVNKLVQDVATLQQQGVMCERTGQDRVQLTVRNTLFHVDTSYEYSRDNEWLQLRWMKPSDPKLMNTINKEHQCTTLPMLVDRLLQYRD